jgi:hypothetical protein
MRLLGGWSRSEEPSAGLVYHGGADDRPKGHTSSLRQPCLRRMRRFFFRLGSPAAVQLYESCMFWNGRPRSSHGRDDAQHGFRRCLEEEAPNHEYFLRFSVDGYAFGINALVYSMTH